MLHLFINRWYIAELMIIDAVKNISMTIFTIITPFRKSFQQGLLVYHWHDRVYVTRRHVQCKLWMNIIYFTLIMFLIKLCSCITITWIHIYIPTVYNTGTMICTDILQTITEPLIVLCSAIDIQYTIHIDSTM